MNEIQKQTCKAASLCCNCVINFQDVLLYYNNSSAYFFCSHIHRVLMIQIKLATTTMSSFTLEVSAYSYLERLQ